MRAIFCGNFEYDARQSDLERLFRRYGKVDRVDMKSGFAFVYMEDERDAEDAIRALDQISFGRKGRRLRVEWTKQERRERISRRPESLRKSSSNARPSKTLFVINFDAYNTRTRDLERHFDPYGKILNVRIRRNFAFIQYENQEDATKALDATNCSKLLDRVISVEYAAKDDDNRRNGYSPDRTRDRSPRRGSDRVRSPSPYKRDRGSPDYRPGRTRSPSLHRKEWSSPVYACGSSRSPIRKERGSEHGRGRSASPMKERDHEHCLSPRRERGHKRSPSPVKERNLKHRPSPQREISNGDADHRPNSREKASPTNGYPPSFELEEGEKVMSPDDYGRSRSPAYSDADSPPLERHAS